MSFIQKILFSMPLVMLGVIMILSVVVFSAIGLLIVRRFVPLKVLKVHNDVTAAIFKAITTAYTVLLAFVVVISWQNFNETEKHTATEANCLVSLYRNSAAFGQPFVNEIRPLIKEYVDVVINEEWKSLSRGEENIKARDILRNIWALYTGYDPKTDKEKIFLAESVRKLDNLREMRRLRIIDSRTGVHPVLWFVLVVGAIITIGFTFFFGLDNFINHTVMVFILGTIIALILLTIISFDFPFTGTVRIGPAAFQQIIGF